MKTTLATQSVALKLGSYTSPKYPNMVFSAYSLLQAGSPVTLRYWAFAITFERAVFGGMLAIGLLNRAFDKE